MADQTSLTKPHAIFFPYPLQGHVIPAVHLAIKLASRGFIVTFINTEAIHHQTSRAHPNAGENPFSRTGLDIRYRTVSDGLPVNFDRSLNHDQFMASLLHVFSAHAEPAVAEIVAASAREGSPVSLIIADTFFVWPSKLAKKFGLVYASFWTEPALVFTLYHHMHLMRKNGHFDCPADAGKETIEYIPGVKAIKPQDMTSYLQATDTSTVCHHLIAAAFEDARGADYTLCNTVQALESETIRALHSDKTPFYAVGPVFPPNFAKSPVATSLWSESDCSAWLDGQPRGSVLYASFGSYAHVAKPDLAEIAHGLSLSGAHFLWVLRPDIVSSDDPDPLPEGFAAEVADRAVMVPWCSQIEVLAHPAIGGFLTHCGWNSILESVWCEVPLLCFPIVTDQFTNRKLVVDDWKIGISLSGQGSVTRHEVAKKVNALLEGVDFGKAVCEVKRSVEEAVRPDGSSERNLDKFIADMKTMARE